MGELYDMQGLHCYVVYSFYSSFSQTYQKNFMSFNSVDNDVFYDWLEKVQNAITQKVLS